MEIGMLWFDNDKQVDLNIKVKRAADYYKKKYRKKPTLCFVNPETNPNNLEKSNNIEIRETSTMLKNHFWIGVKSSD